MATKQAPRGVILSRLSDKAAENKVETVEVQEAKQGEIADALGVPIVARFAEDGVSGIKRVKRPSFAAMLELLEHDGITHVFARNIDRTSRRMSAQWLLIEACEDFGVTLVLDGRAVDIEHEDGALAMDTYRARREGKLIRKRTADAHATMLRNGTYVGRVPFGFSKPDFSPPGYLEQRPDEAQAVRDGFRMIVHEHRSSAAVAREWNERGLTTTYGRAFTASKAQRTLEAPVMAGLRVRDGEVLAELKLPDGSPFPAILTRPERDELRAVLGARARRIATGSGATPRAGLLSGVACCGKCGAPLAIHRHRDAPERSFYACRADGRRCNGCSIKVALVEPHIERAVLDVLQSAKVRRKLARERRTKTTPAEDPAVLQRLIDELDVQRGKGEISERRYQLTMPGYEARLAKALDAIADDGEYAALFPFTSGDVEKTWKATSDEHRQSVVAALIERIDVQPVARQGSRPPVDERIRPRDIAWRI